MAGQKTAHKCLIRVRPLFLESKQTLPSFLNGRKKLLICHFISDIMDFSLVTIGTVTNMTCIMSRMKNMSFSMPLLGN